jgi:DNA-binding SARP family transcriptional activator
VSSAVSSEVNVLGPVELRLDGQVVAVTGPKVRLTLATLAASANRVVSTDRLIEALWGDDPPRAAEHSLQQHISVLRKHLDDTGGDAPTVLATRHPGYCLDVDRCDVHTWAEHRRAGQRALEEGRPDDAIVELDAALGLWRGDAFEDAGDSPVISAVATQLHEERIAVHEARSRAMLATGREAELVGDLEALVRMHPMRERLWGDLMIALYRSGRQADALGAFQSARTALVEGLGIEPSAALRDLETAILQQSPTLDGSGLTAAEPAGDGLAATFVPGDPTEVGTVVLPDGQEVRLRPGTAVIGRDPSVTIRLVDSRVSRRHATIEVSERGCKLRDLGSSNGTTLNGANVDVVELSDGDQIGVGEVVLTFRRSS